MRLLLLGLAIFLAPLIGVAQDHDEHKKPNRNHILLEGGGAGVYGSVNYEYLFAQSKKNKLLGRVGFFTYTGTYQPTPTDIYDYREFIVPIGVTYLYGVKNHLELSVNQSFLIENNKMDNTTSVGFLICPTVGYRRENFFRNTVYYNIGFSPWFRYEHTDWEFQAFLKAGLGFSF